MLLLALLACTAAVDPPVDPLSTITAADVSARIQALTAPEMQGRLAGGPGYDRAVAWAEGELSALGLELRSQQLTVEHNQVQSAHLSLLLGEKEQDLTLGQDFVLRGFTGSGSFEGPVLFAGYGLVTEGWDSYGQADASGRAALVFKHPPSWKPSEDQGWGEVHLPRPKARAAAAKGAGALLMISKPMDEPPQALIGSTMHGPGEQPARMPQVHISQAAAASLLGVDELGPLQAGIDEAHAPAPQEGTGQVRLEVQATYTAEAPTTNVVAVLPGTDLADHWIVIGAHLDHVGHQAELVFPGANDNASGSAAVLEMAQAFVQGGVKPRRSVAFVLFSAEEQGLNGSRAFAEAGPIPVSQVDAMLNLDCVGHGDGLRVGGKGAFPDGWQIVRDHDLSRTSITVDQSWHTGGADATPFADAGVPTLYFAAEHAYTHLHLPSDTLDTVDTELNAEIARLAFLAARDLASLDAIPFEPADG